MKLGVDGLAASAKRKKQRGDVKGAHLGVEDGTVDARRSRQRPIEPAAAAKRLAGGRRRSAFTQTPARGAQYS